jgi:hypothetical protein
MEKIRESRYAVTGYVGLEETIHVDTFHKLVIIAIGGKIGNPPPSRFGKIHDRSGVDNHPPDGS